MVLTKKATRNKLLIWVVSFLVLTSEVSFSEEDLDSKLEVTANSEELVSDENQPNPKKLYTIKLHHKNKSSESLVYASFDESQQKYAVVCQSEDDRYQDALERCEDLKDDINIGSSIKIAGFRRNTKDFKASEYRDQNKIWQLFSKLVFKNYPVNLDVLLPETKSKELFNVAMDDVDYGSNQDMETGANSKTRSKAESVLNSEYSTDDGNMFQPDEHTISNLESNITPSNKIIAGASIGAGFIAVNFLGNDEIFYSSKVSEIAPEPNLILNANGVQWERYIPDGNVKKIMETYDRFFAEKVTDNIFTYDDFEEAVAEKASFKLITIDNTRTIKPTKELGGGGSKKFYDIGKDEALAIIKGDHQHYDELMMLRYVETLNILTNKIKPAVIRWKVGGVQYSRATYTAPSFNSYAQRDAFVLDSKNVREVVDRLGENKILPEGANSFELENWDKPLKLLVEDIRTLVDNGVSTQGDTLNAILVGKGNDWHKGSDGYDGYEVRAFPFDFSSKYYYKQFPVKEALSVEDERGMLEGYIKLALFVQYNYNAHDLSEEWQELQKKLTERYLRKR